MHYPYYPEDLMPSREKNDDFPAPAMAQNPPAAPNIINVPNMPSVPRAPSAPNIPGTPPNQGLVRTIEYEGPASPFGSTGIPTVIPEPPHFSVPSNPLLPERYKEILSYEDLQNMNGFLRTQIGKECMVVSALGASGNVVSRLGYLIGVGLNYLLLQDSCSEAIMVIDFYSIHLVQIMGKRCPINLLI
jgi:hypothetical protein